MKKWIFFLVLIPICHGRVFYTAGTFVPYFNQVQVSDSGSKQFFDLNPHLSIGTVMQMTGSHFFMPELGLTYYLENAKKTKKRVTHLHYDFGYVINSSSILRYGLTNHWYTIVGEGGTVVLRNGSTYKTFNAPGKTVTTYFTTLDFGYEYFFKPEMSLRFDLNMMGFQDQENSAFNYLLTVNFYR